MNRCDMSQTCGMKYYSYWNAVHKDHSMSQDYFECWLDRNCNQCKYMSDVCMFDPDEDILVQDRRHSVEITVSVTDASGAMRTPVKDMTWVGPASDAVRKEHNEALIFANKIIETYMKVDDLSNVEKCVIAHGDTWYRIMYCDKDRTAILSVIDSEV